MQIAKIVIGIAALAGATLAYADGFVVTRPMSDGREVRLVEHAAECKGTPGAFVYRNGEQIEHTCNVRLTGAGATVMLPAFYPRRGFPRETLYQDQ